VSGFLCGSKEISYRNMRELPVFYFGRELAVEVIT